jgi:glycosyltransferase involved in cell wall biosynthesis
VISVIIPHYDGVIKLKRLLDSVPRHINVIIVDDCSPDQRSLTLLVQGYSNVALSRTPHNSGAGAARNIGLSQLIKGKVLFADGDDYFEEDAFSIIEEYQFDSADIVFFNPTSVVENTSEVGTRHTKYSNLIRSYSEGFDEAIKYQFVVPWSKLYDVNFLRENDINFEEIKASNDVMFSVKSGHLANEVKVDERIVYCVTQSHTSLTNSLTEKMFDIRFRALLKANAFLQSQNASKYQLKMLVFVVRSLKFGFLKFFKTTYIILKNKHPIFNFFK